MAGLLAFYHMLINLNTKVKIITSFLASGTLSHSLFVGFPRLILNKLDLKPLINKQVS